MVPLQARRRLLPGPAYCQAWWLPSWPATDLLLPWGHATAECSDQHVWFGASTVGGINQDPDEQDTDRENVFQTI